MLETILTYPKSQITKSEVLKQKAKFQFPEAWAYSTTKTTHVLTFKEDKAIKYYAGHKK